MSHSITGWTLITAAAVTLLAMSPASAPAQTPPRTQDGQPDLQGIWQTLNSADWNLQAHAAEKGIPAGMGVLIGVYWWEKDRKSTTH